MSQAVPVPLPGQGGVCPPTAASCAALVLQRVNEENTPELQEETTALPHVLPTCLFHVASGGSGCASKRSLGAAAAAAPLHNPIHLSSASLTTLPPIFSSKGILLSWISIVLPKEAWGAPGPLSPKEPTTYPGVPPCSPSECAESSLPRLSSPRPATEAISATGDG